MTVKIFIQTQIDTSVYPPEHIVIIKKLDKLGNGRGVVRYGLSKGGEWIEKVEGQRYDDACIFKIDNYDTDASIYS